jgi:hypothetical protein
MILPDVRERIKERQNLESRQTAKKARTIKLKPIWMFQLMEIEKDKEALKLLTLPCDQD